MTLAQLLGKLVSNEVQLDAVTTITETVDRVTFDLHGFDQRLAEVIITAVEFDDMVSVFRLEHLLHGEHY
ncbi:hypothetical protein D3C86_1625330 [compost metagenome]